MSKEEYDKAKNDPQKSKNYLIRVLIGPGFSEYNDILMKTCCTSCIMIIDETNKKLYFANAGDSRVVICCEGNVEAMLKIINQNQIVKKLEYIIKPMFG